jgi:hypothetical protein
MNDVERIYAIAVLIIVAYFFTKNKQKPPQDDPKDVANVTDSKED